MSPSSLAGFCANLLRGAQTHQGVRTCAAPLTRQPPPPATPPTTSPLTNINISAMETPEISALPPSHKDIHKDSLPNPTLVDHITIPGAIKM